MFKPVLRTTLNDSKINHVGRRETPTYANLWPGCMYKHGNPNILVRNINIKQRENP